jgi:hypothetical protein
MMSYRDMTFCTFFEDCKHQKTCHRPLTDAVREKAKQWWGKDDVPISIFAQQPECHEVKGKRK